MPCGEVVEVEAEVAAVLGTALPVVGGEAAGVVRGGAATGSAAFAGAGAGSWGLGWAGLLASEERGGASRARSRAAEMELLAGLVKPAGWALSERRLIRGFSPVGLSKLNSAESAPDSG